MSRTNSAMRNNLNKTFAENGHNIKAEQWGMLNVIKLFSGQTQIELAERLGKDRTNVTRMIDVLEREQLLERKGDSKDRRIYRIYLTDKGEETIESLIPFVEKVNSESVKGISSEKVIELKNLLLQIQKNINKD